jgi:hypothetical protein
MSRISLSEATGANTPNFRLAPISHLGAVIDRGVRQSAKLTLARSWRSCRPRPPARIRPPLQKHSSVFLAAVDECDRGSTRASSTVPSHRLRDRIHVKGGFSDRTQPATPPHGERLPHPGGWLALRTSSMQPTSGDRGRQAILGVGADHHELTEPPVDRLSLHVHRRVEVEIRFDLFGGS